MYCIQCGVELADSEKKCPLCGTAVFHPELSRPDGEPPYPPERRSVPEEVNRSGLLFIVTVLFALPVAITLLCDWQINGRLLWSGYAAGGIILAYILVVLPLWFRKPSAIILLPVDFAAVALYLLYIDINAGGHWYLSFALPVTAASGLIVCACVTLLKYLRRGRLFVYGGLAILTGAHMVLIEFLLNLTFGLHKTFIWSFYPFTACFIIGIMLLVIAICRPLRESLHKKFFL